MNEMLVWQRFDRMTKASIKACYISKAPPHTIIHGDLRLSNFLWERLPGSSEPTPVLLDWQLACRGKPGADLGPLLCWDLPVQTRREHERRLLDMYLAEMYRCGLPPTECVVPCVSCLVC